MRSPTPIEVFYSYAHEDRLFCDELKKHLSLLCQQGLITQWYDHHISPGSNRAQAISTHLEHASVILLLVSANFLASDYCYSIDGRQVKCITGKFGSSEQFLKALHWHFYERSSSRKENDIVEQEPPPHS